MIVTLVMLFVTKLVIIIYNYWLYLNKKMYVYQFLWFFRQPCEWPSGLMVEK